MRPGRHGAATSRSRREPRGHGVRRYRCCGCRAAGQIWRQSCRGLRRSAADIEFGEHRPVRREMATGANRKQLPGPVEDGGGGRVAGEPLDVGAERALDERRLGRSRRCREHQDHDENSSHGFMVRRRPRNSRARPERHKLANLGSPACTALGDYCHHRDHDRDQQPAGGRHNDEVESRLRTRRTERDGAIDTQRGLEPGRWSTRIASF